MSSEMKIDWSKGGDMTGMSEVRVNFHCENCGRRLPHPMTDDVSGEFVCPCGSAYSWGRKSNPLPIPKPLGIDKGEAYPESEADWIDSEEADQ